MPCMAGQSQIVNQRGQQDRSDYVDASCWLYAVEIAISDLLMDDQVETQEC